MRRWYGPLRLQTTLIEDLLKFVENSIPKLDHFRLEIKKGRNGVLISDLVPMEPMSEID
jgi:hypothetical protein